METTFAYRGWWLAHFNLSSSLFLSFPRSQVREACVLSRFFCSCPGRRDALFSYVNEIASVESSWKHPSSHLKCGVSKWINPPKNALGPFPPPPHKGMLFWMPLCLCLMALRCPLSNSLLFCLWTLRCLRTIFSHHKF
jgi:hypothetical protein